MLLFFILPSIHPFIYFSIHFLTPAYLCFSSCLGLIPFLQRQNHVVHIPKYNLQNTIPVRYFGRKKGSMVQQVWKRMYTIVQLAIHRALLTNKQTYKTRQKTMGISLVSKIFNVIYLMQYFLRLFDHPKLFWLLKSIESSLVGTQGNGGVRGSALVRELGDLHFRVSSTMNSLGTASGTSFPSPGLGAPFIK